MSKFNRSRALLGLALLCTFQSGPAVAQGAAPINWETKQQNAINQDAASGLINANQASYLQNREAQIQAQQQQYMNQNGGTLNPAQQNQINSELRRVNGGISRDVRNDALNNQSFAQGTGQFVGQPYQNRFNGQGQWQNNNYNNQPYQLQGSNQQWQNNNHFNAQQWQNQQSPFMGQGQAMGHGHHHHDGDHDGWRHSGSGASSILNGWGQH